MKIKYEDKSLPPTTITKFTEANDLTILVVRQDERYEASFQYARMRDGTVWIDVIGFGVTADGAIKDYADKIAGRVLDLPGKRIRVPTAISHPNSDSIAEELEKIKKEKKA